MVLYAPTHLLKGVKSTFLEELAAQPASIAERVATVVQSDSDLETYGWLGQSPQVAEAADQVEFSALTDTSYALTNKKYWSGLEVKRDDINDEKTGGIALRVRQLALVAARNYNKLICAALEDSSSTGYDGVALFSDSHTARKDEGSTQDNLLAGSGTSTANASTDINTGIKTLLTFKGENGEPVNEAPTQFWIVAPALMRQPILEAINATIISNTSNVSLQGLQFFPYFTGRLTDDNDWYMGVSDSAIRALLLQEREPITFEALEGGSDEEFMREVYRYKARQRCVVGIGMWNKAVKFVNT